MNKILNVAYHCSDMFAPILGASLVSLFENNKGMEEINVYIFENPFSDENRSKLNGLASQYGRKIFYLPMPDVNKEQKLGLKSVKKMWFFNSYVRLFLSDYLPDSVDKVLYLDSDVLVVDDLTELINTDLHGCCAAGIVDTCAEVYFPIYGLDKKAQYCNSGVIFEDLTLWRKKNIGERIREYVKSNGGYVFYMDQTTFNAVLQNEIFILHPRYNCYSRIMTLSYKNILRERNPYNYTSEKLIKEAQAKPAIIHMTTTFLSNNRPWVEGSNHVVTPIYQHYKAMSPWKDTPNFPDKRSKVKRIADFLVAHLPRFIVLPLAEVAFNRFRVNKIKRITKKALKQQNKD